MPLNLPACHAASVLVDHCCTHQKVTSTRWQSCLCLQSETTAQSNFMCQHEHFAAKSSHQCSHPQSGCSGAAHSPSHTFSSTHHHRRKENFSSPLRLPAAQATHHAGVPAMHEWAAWNAATVQVETPAAACGPEGGVSTFTVRGNQQQACPLHEAASPTGFSSRATSC